VIAAESSEHEQLRSAVTAVLQREVPLSRSVADAERPDGYDRVLWRRLATELGIAGLSVPERFGGAAAGMVAEAVVAAELGAALTCTPYLSTIALAANLLMCAGDEAASGRYLPALTSGDSTAAVVVRSWDGTISAAALGIDAEQRAGAWNLDGRARFVIDGHSADLLLVAALTGTGPRLFAVDGSAAGLLRRRARTMDHLRASAELTFDGVVGEPFGPEDAWPAVERMLDLATVALAAEQATAATAVLDATVGYTAVRVQFARTIGSFQAVKHRCAETLVSNDRARSAVEHAIWVADHDIERLPAAAAMAALVCGPAFRHAAHENVQLHGGIGFTWEHPAHRYFRRATADAALLADRQWYEDRLLAGIGVTIPRADTTTWNPTRKGRDTCM
jgi:alkylation response protein AidB-like acyl-CoA dehydrogenase